MTIGACTGTPTFNFDVSESWPIYGKTVQFAVFDFDAHQLLVQYVDKSYVIVDGIGMFTWAQANEAAVLALVAANPTHC